MVATRKGGNLEGGSGGHSHLRLKVSLVEAALQGCRRRRSYLWSNRSDQNPRMKLLSHLAGHWLIQLLSTHCVHPAPTQADPALKKAQHRRIDAFELWCWKRLLGVPWSARKSNQSILKEINSEYSLEGLMLKLKLQYFGHLM